MVGLVRHSQRKRRETDRPDLRALAPVYPTQSDCPVGTVDISGDGAGDQVVGSPDVNVLEGWTQV
jgi:hypothetical protein